MRPNRADEGATTWAVGFFPGNWNYPAAAPTVISRVVFPAAGLDFSKPRQGLFLSYDPLDPDQPAGWMGWLSLTAFAFLDRWPGPARTNPLRIEALSKLNRPLHGGPCRWLFQRTTKEWRRATGRLKPGAVALQIAIAPNSMARSSRSGASPAALTPPARPTRSRTGSKRSPSG